MRVEMEEHMTETTQSDHYTSKSETEEDSEDSTRKQPTRKVKKMESKKRKKIQEDSDSESESTDKTQSKKKKVVVEDLSPEQAQSYHGYSTLEKQVDLRSPEGHYISYETILDVNLESDDPSSQGHTEQTEENMMVMREETPSEVLAITPEPPQQLEESTPTLPPTPSKINPAPEDAAAMMMMAWRASYVPRIDPMPSFSFGSTDSSQEETATAKTPETPKLLEQLGDLVQKIVSGGMSTKEKSPQIPKESGAKSFEKFETPARMNENSSDMKEKCYLWTLQVKTDADGRTNEFDNIVSAMCFILNQKKIPRFQEEVYCLPPDIVNMAIINHPKGVFLQPTTNKPFKVEDYPMFIPFLDLKKLASHHYDKDKEIEPPYLNILGQKTSYDCAIYVMKWLEILNPANINRRKYEWENWSQDEVDHFRVEYASRILFHDMNLDKAEAIRGSRLTLLLKGTVAVRPWNSGSKANLMMSPKVIMVQTRLSFSSPSSSSPSPIHSSSNPLTEKVTRPEELSPKHNIFEEEVCFEDINQAIDNWEIPKIPQDGLYFPDDNKRKSDYIIKTAENNIPLGPDSGEEFHLLTKQSVREHARHYRYLHIGCVQVAVKPLIREGLNASILMCLRDIRHNDFQDSLIGTIETSPGHGPVYFNCFPNKTVSLLDLNILDSLFLNIQIHGLNMKEGSIPATLIYRIQYKVMNTCNSRVLLKFQDRETTLFVTDMTKANVMIPRLIRWDEIDLPQSWSIDRAIPTQLRQAPLL
ncbi:polyprotein [Arachis hypogaea]|nr:polyprotein [Arachis hypogaea]